MPKTIQAEHSGTESVGYVLLTFLSEKTKSEITELLKNLTTELPGVLWPMPAEQLHITLCEIIQPKIYKNDKEELYKLHREQYESVPALILSSVSKFKVVFDTIEVSPHAVIIRASNTQYMNSIRGQLADNLSLPEETRTPPDITHSTIARYTEEIDVNEIQKVVNMHSISIEEDITEFKLLRNTVPPLAMYDVIQTYPLA